MLATLPLATLPTAAPYTSRLSRSEGRPPARRVRLPDTASDEELMTAIAAGEQQPFDLLARRHTQRIYRLAYRICGNDGDAHEIAQEALIRVWTSAPRWQPTARFTTWLYRVVVNLCFDRRRKPVTAPLEEAGDPADPAASAFDQLGEREFSQQIAQVLNTLPERQRAAIALCYYQELPNAEAAAVMSVSVSAMEALLVRARRTLAVRLAPLRTERLA